MEYAILNLFASKALGRLCELSPYSFWLRAPLLALDRRSCHPCDQLLLAVRNFFRLRWWFLRNAIPLGITSENFLEGIESGFVFVSLLWHTPATDHRRLLS